MFTNTFEVTLAEQVVHHPALKILALFVTANLLIGAMLLSPILVPLHYFLRVKGRNGFFFDRHICIDKESFARREP